MATLPRVGQDLPRDPRNTARETRARFEYQDVCVVLRCIPNLLPDSLLTAVVVEWTSDYVVVARDGRVELVSVKHREEDQPPWNFSALAKEHVFRDLHGIWKQIGEDGDYVFESNRGISVSLRTAVEKATDPGTGQAATLAGLLGVSADEAARFASRLIVPADPVPGRLHIHDVAMGRLAEVMPQLGLDPRLAHECVTALEERVAAVAVDRQPEPRQRVQALAGLMRDVRDRGLKRVRDFTLTMDELRDIVAATAARGRAEARGHPSASYPLADGREAESARRRAELDAIAQYRSRLTRQDGMVGLALVDDFLPEMTYAPLADSLRAGGPLLGIARRWRRLVLTGLPGMGKSTALEQLAARWAADERAPTPIRVALRDVARRNPRSAADITPAVLIDIATATAPEEERIALRRALQEELVTGRAALLLDGLDECGAVRAVVADGLGAVARDIHADAGMIIATRDSGIAAAARLGFPEARLTEPAWLKSMLIRLLEHASKHRVPAEADRRAWFEGRLRQLDELLATHHELCSVPLFAVLLTLLISRRETSEVQIGRAQLLSQAVTDAVDRWELNRLSETDSRRDLRREQLLDGYGEIAHALVDGPAGQLRSVVSRRLEAMLSSEWGLSPGETRARAQDIIWFWDERMGLFVARSPDAGLMEARSRVFAEIGDAMWASSCRAHDIRRAWTKAAVGDADRREQAILAASLSDDIAAELIEEAASIADASSRSRALLLAVDALIDGARTVDGALQTLITALAGDAANRTGTPAKPLKMHGLHVTRPAQPGWFLVVGIAMLPLPKALRVQRNQAIARLTLDAEEAIVAKALVALADARMDASGRLDPGQEKAVRELLAMELPNPPLYALKPGDTPGSVTVNREAKPLHGHYEAVNQAAEYIGQLGGQAAESMYRVAHRGTAGNYGNLQWRLTRAGYPDPDPRGLISGTISAMTRNGDIWEEWESYLVVAAQLAQPRKLSHAEQWSYPNLAVLDDILDSGEATLDGIELAFTTERPLLADCIKAVAHSAGLSSPAIAAEAASALECWRSGDRGVIDVMFAPPPGTPPPCHASRLDEHDTAAMLAAIGAASDWIADIACKLLTLEPDPGIGQRTELLIDQIPANRRINAAIVIAMNDPDPANKVRELLRRDDRVVRIGASIAAHVLAGREESVAWKPILEQAIGDYDLAVRMAAGAELTGSKTALCWTCGECGWTNKIDSASCESCGRTMNFSTPRNPA